MSCYLEATDSLTGKTARLPITKDTIQSNLLSSEFGITVCDTGYLNTAVCESSVSYIDGDRGILRYRGYDIEELAEKSSFLEVAFLLIYGELPSVDQLDAWTTRVLLFSDQVMRHTFIHENMVDFLKHFRYDAHPMVIT
jgi:citrate synthase